jgi:uncharacterized protein
MAPGAEADRRDRGRPQESRDANGRTGRGCVPTVQNVWVRMNATVSAGTEVRVGGARSSGAAWAALLVLVAIHFGIQAGARHLWVFRSLTNDPLLLAHGSWLHYWNHHLAQMAIALALIGILTRGRLRAAGLNLANARESVRLLTTGFFPVLLMLLIAGHTIVPIVQGVPPERFAAGVRAMDVVGLMIFSWVIVGLSEEVVFRGFFQTALARFWHGSAMLFGVPVPVAGLLAAAIFTLAHDSFRPMSADPRQLVLAFVLGVYYAVAYFRTGSLLAPIIAHNLVDGGIVTAEWMVAELVF